VSITELLKRSVLFSGLTPEQLDQIAALSREATYNAGDVVIQEGAPSNEVYIIREGMVEVLISKIAIADVPGAPQLTPVVRLGNGQFFGEMALVDRGARSATVRCAKDGTVLYVIQREDFWELCDSNHHIGYIVMRNIAFDLSFKLRHQNLQAKLAGAGGGS
jgi:CRP-like cAMP-binding protein